MKLKTEMFRTYNLGKPLIYVFYGEPKDATRLAHDAAAAHALMRAINEFASYGNKDDADSLRKRANEIMRELGYEVE